MSRLLLTDPAPASEAAVRPSDSRAREQRQQGEQEVGAGLPHINAWRRATARDVEGTLHMVEHEFDLFRARVLQLLRNLDENLALNNRLHINSFIGTLADLQNDVTGDLMGVGDNIEEE